MLFHVTITHGQDDCPGRRPADTPELIGPAERLEALGAELSVTSHSLVWGAACMLWAEPEHVAYALLEAASLEAVERYVDALTPAGWATRALPVFTLPSQLGAVRQFLAAPAVPVAPATAPAIQPADDREAADTLEGVTVGSSEPVEDESSALLATPALDVARTRIEPPYEPPDTRVTRETPGPVVVSPPVVLEPIVPPAVAPPPVTPRPQASPPVVPPVRKPSPDPLAVTRFIQAPSMQPGPVNSPPPPEQPSEAVPPSESDSASQSSTVILEPNAQGSAGLRLVASLGPAQGSVFEVGQAGATLGRLPENSICLTDGRLSRYHARIEFRHGGYWLSDLASQNGTLVNDRPLTEPHRLQTGDSIQLGTSRMTVVLDPDD